MPRISVIIAVFDGARYVAAAVESALAQSWRDLEVVVVDDASSDGTLAVLAPLAARDRRLRLISLPTNLGPFGAANVGLEQTDSDVIARLDADDLCHPERLERQWRCLTSNPELGLVGSDVVLIDGDGNRRGLAPSPYDDLAIRWHCLLRPPFHHSSVMWRRALGLRYDARLRVGGDYELWGRALALTRARNLKSPCVSYRVWRGGITGERRAEQRRVQDEVAEQLLARDVPQVPVARATLSALRSMLVANRHHAPLQRPPLDERRALAATYRALFAGFMAGRPPSPEAERLARAVDRRARALVEAR